QDAHDCRRRGQHERPSSWRPHGKILQKVLRARSSRTTDTNVELYTRLAWPGWPADEHGRRDGDIADPEWAKCPRTIERTPTKRTHSHSRRIAAMPTGNGCLFMNSYLPSERTGPRLRDQAAEQQGFIRSCARLSEREMASSPSRVARKWLRFSALTGGIADGR